MRVVCFLVGACLPSVVAATVIVSCADTQTCQQATAVSLTQPCASNGNAICGTANLCSFTIAAQGTSCTLSGCFSGGTCDGLGKGVSNCICKDTCKTATSVCPVATSCQGPAACQLGKCDYAPLKADGTSCVPPSGSACTSGLCTGGVCKCQTTPTVPPPAPTPTAAPPPPVENCRLFGRFCCS